MSLNAWFSQVKEEDLQQEREQILDAGPQDIRNLAELVDAVMKQNRFCVIGSEEKLQQEKELFQEMKYLL